MINNSADADLPAHDARRDDARTDPSLTPINAVISWVGWHTAELAGVLVPVALAATVSPWFAVPAALVAAGWIAHEIRVSGQQQLLRAAVERHALSAGPTEETESTKRMEESA
ncbi:MAG TPA: hypothetical protein VHX38_17520 [Pseudonocardiaceae bacterium]|nr:hypothetical protein [Pseudonocardiaceae bacterium]